MKVIFMGTPDFAVPSLESLIASGHEVAAVFTQPDKPVGRKQILTPPQVKVRALAHGIQVHQPVSLRDAQTIQIIRELAPDVIVVAAYGKILPTGILGIPTFGCINVHASLLPKYRGAAPIQWSVINGDQETGVTIMQMAAGLDTGDILLQKKISIERSDTAESMFEKLSALGAEMICEALDALSSGEISPCPQDDEKATYAPMLSKELSLIDWSQPSERVYDLIRGLYSWPIAQTYLNGKKLRVFSAFPCDEEGEPGTVIKLLPLTVACGKGSLIIRELQLEGKKRMDAKSFLAGHPLSIGQKLGESHEF